MSPGTTWSEPAGGFFIWVEFPKGIDAEKLLPDAIDAGVTYLPGSFCYADDGGTHNARISFSHVSPAEIDEGVEALASAVRAATHGSRPTAERATDGGDSLRRPGTTAQTTRFWRPSSSPSVYRW